MLVLCLTSNHKILGLKPSWTPPWIYLSQQHSDVVLAPSLPNTMHMQVDQIANTFDRAIRGYVVGQESENRMQSINDAVNFVQNTVCTYQILSCTTNCMNVFFFFFFFCI